MKSSPGDPSHQNMALLSFRSLGTFGTELYAEGTCDPCGKWASRDLFVVKFDHDVVIAASGGEVRHCACPVFVVLAGNLSFRRTLDSKRETACMDSIT